jgi:hypothetical protein
VEINFVNNKVFHPSLTCLVRREKAAANPIGNFAQPKIQASWLNIFLRNLETARIDNPSGDGCVQELVRQHSFARGQL